MGHFATHITASTGPQYLHTELNELDWMGLKNGHIIISLDNSMLIVACQTYYPFHPSTTGNDGQQSVSLNSL